MISDSLLILIIRALGTILSLVERHLEATGKIDVPSVARSKVND